LIEKCYFQVSCEFSAKSGVIDHLTLAVIDVLATPGLQYQ